MRNYDPLGFLARVGSIFFVPAVTVLAIHLLRVTLDGSATSVFLLLWIPFAVAVIAGIATGIAWPDVKKCLGVDPLVTLALSVIATVIAEASVVAILALRSGDFLLWFRPWAEPLLIVLAFSTIAFIAGISWVPKR